ncbi:MAG: hypothetical protein JNM86_07905 [Phycisphaerae bacterium]|nr:hypothetical protein [Phycisphaerae bacterium]MBN8599274.1 hypothetical protein [Planctomycetota bacterium]
MIKVINKYRQYMLVAFGVVLMVAFIVPQANHLFIGDQMTRKVATINGAKVTAGDMNRARSEFEVIRNLLDPLGLRLDLAKELFGAENERHWLLLSHAAQDGGFMGTAADGKQFEKEIRDGVLVPQLARGAAVQRNPFLRQAPQYIDMLASQELADPEKRKAMEEEAGKRLDQAVARAAANAHATPADVQLAFAKANAIGRMQTAWRETHRVSDKRAMLEADESGDVVYVDQSLMLAKVIAPFAPAPPAELVEKLFNEFKNVKRGDGEHGFGYRLPARIKLEWMTIDRAAIAASVQLDPVDVNKFWRQNRAKFPGDFAAERTKVESDLRNQRVDAIFTTIDKAVRSETIRVLGKVETKGGYRVLPADWQSRAPRMESLAQMTVSDVKEMGGGTIPLPQVVVRSDQFLNRADVSGIAGIGESMVRVGTKEYPLPELLFKVREIAGNEPDIGLQVGVPFDNYAQDPQGNRYYFTVLEARKEEAPTSIDEVRAQVELDAKALDQFEKLSGQAEIMRTVTVTDGFEGLAKYFVDAFPGASPPVQRRKLAVTVNNIQGSDSTFNQPEYRDAVIKAAKALDPLKPVIDYPADQRTIAVVMFKPLTVAIVQLIGRAPVSIERMRVEGDSFAGGYANKELPSRSVREAFSFSALKDRMKFVDLARNTDEPETPPTPASPAADSPKTDAPNSAG